MCAWIIVSSEMEVVDVPQNKPIITEIKTHYRIGELVRGNCSSQYSKPAANLTWLINDMPVMITTTLMLLLTDFLIAFLSLIYFLILCVCICVLQTAISIRQYPLLKDETRNLVSNTIGLFLRLSQQHFSNGRLKVCEFLAIFSKLKVFVSEFYFLMETLQIVKLIRSEKLQSKPYQ